MRTSTPSHGQARGGGHVLERVAGPGQRHVACLGEPVAGHQRLERKFVVRSGGSSSTGMSAAPVTPARSVDSLPLSLDVEQRVIQRRRAGQHRDPFALNEFHHAVDVEDGDRQHRRAAQERRDEAGLEAERVEVRVDHQVAVALAQIRERRPFLVHPQRLAVIHHGALGPPGGARGEDDVGDRRRSTADARALERSDRSDQEVGLQIDDGHAGAATSKSWPRKPFWTSTPWRRCGR